MSWILSAQGIRDLDAQIAEKDLLVSVLENVGRSVAEKILSLYPCDHTVLVLCGKGFNGSDALFTARHLILQGIQTRILSLENPWQHTLSAFAAVEPLTPETLRAALRETDLIVDGLLGTGRRPTELPSQDQGILNLLSQTGKPVVSIDLPSGLVADQPVLLSPTARATHTLALGSLKPCLVFSPTREQAGHIHLIPLAIPEPWIERHAKAKYTDAHWVSQHLPKRSRCAHKGNAGEVWIFGGQLHMQGAPLLAGQAALTTGSGIVRTFSDPPLNRGYLELIHHHLEERHTLPKPTALAIGMGLGTHATKLTEELLSWKIPIVIDADSLQPQYAGQGHDQTIWTPHPKEAARMLGTQTADILANPLESALEIQKQFGGQVVLKGGPTAIASTEWPSLFVNSSGNPAMASAGMGDVLSGVLASLLGQGMTAQKAAPCGVFLHGLSGDLQTGSGFGLQAHQVAEHIGSAWQRITHE